MFMAQQGFTDADIEKAMRLAHEFARRTLADMGLPAELIQAKGRMFRDGQELIPPTIISQAGTLELTGNHLAVLRGAQLGFVAVMEKVDQTSARWVLEDMSKHGLITDLKMVARAASVFYTADFTTFGRQTRQYFADRYQWDADGDGAKGQGGGQGDTKGADHG
jgi:hypothetical protein